MDTETQRAAQKPSVGARSDTVSESLFGDTSGQSTLLLHAPGIPVRTRGKDDYGKQNGQDPQTVWHQETS